MSEKRKVLKAAGVIGFFTLISRMTGLARDIVVAHMLGAGTVSDVFWFAFALPNLVRRVLGEGALSAFIVPILTERRTEKGVAEGWRLFNQVVNLLLLVTVALTLVGMFFPRETFLLLGGLGMKMGMKVHGGNPQVLLDSMELGALYTRIMFPYIIILTVSALMMGACNTLGRFATAALGSVMLNVTMIAAGILGLYTKVPLERGGGWICWAVLAGAFLRIVLMAPTLWRGGWRWALTLNLKDPLLLKLLSMMGLALVAMSAGQVNDIISNQFAGWLGEGVKTYLIYAQRLIQFPMALTATAVATAMLPQLSRFLTEGRHRELHDLMGFVKRMELIFMVPAMVGLAVFGLPIVQLLFQGRSWTAEQSLGTYVALLFYAPGLLPQGWLRVLIPLCYARKDMATPIKAAVISLAVNVALNAVFAFWTPMMQAGLALAFTLSSFVNYGVMAWLMRKDLVTPAGEPRPQIAQTLWKTMLASLAAVGLGAWLYVGLVQKAGLAGSRTREAVALAIAMGAVVVLYFALVRLLRTPDSERAGELIMRKLRRKA